MTPESGPGTEFMLLEDESDEPTEFVIVDDPPSSVDLVPVDERGEGCRDLEVYPRDR